ncbi:MAG: hypothetical protein ACXW1S_01975, partial [Acidimicrobiia bacterium]
AIDLAAGGILEPIGEPGEAGAAGMRVVLTRVGRLLGDDVTARLLLAGAVAPADALPTPTRLALGRLEC